MSYLQKKGDRTRFYVIDSQCIGRRCFQPGHYQTRGGTLSGSRNTGDSKPTCMQNAYRGCPYEDGEVVKPDPELAKQRRVEGWKNV